MNKNDFPCTVLRERNDNDDMMIPKMTCSYVMSGGGGKNVTSSSSSSRAAGK